MDDVELLKALYAAIAWDKLYRIAPHASREDVDELFRRLAEVVGRTGGRRASPSAPAPGPEGKPPPPGQTRLYCDGASSGNPGPAGIGMVLCAADGTEIEAWGRPIGRATNNVAEYTALIEGLARALELGVQDIEAVSDSQLLVRQLTGRYKVRSPALIVLHRSAQDLLRRFRSWRLTAIPRSDNRRADAVATAQIKKLKSRKRG